MTGTRRLLATITTRSSNRRHILAAQRQSIAALVARAHARDTLCGRKVDGRGMDLAPEQFDSDLHCKQCRLVAEGRGWI